jgi:hypothetical protein
MRQDDRLPPVQVKRARADGSQGLTLTPKMAEAMARRVLAGSKSKGKSQSAKGKMAARRSGEAGDVEQNTGHLNKDVAVKVFGFVQVNKVGRGHAQGFA